MSNTLFVTLVVDCSGSMGTIAPAMNSAISEALGALENESRTVILDVWQFADTVRHVVKGASPCTVVGKDLVVPRGMTALNDAIGSALVDLLERPHRADDEVRVLIVTDGLENSSREWTTEGVKTLIEQRKAAGWDIAYMGANVDVAHETASRGIDTSLRYNATDAGVRAASVSMSTYLSTGAFGEPAIDPETVVPHRGGNAVSVFDWPTGGPILSVSSANPFLSSFTPSVRSQDQR